MTAEPIKSGLEGHPAADRDRWIDAARGLGIALVVYGHTMRGLFGAGIAESEGILLFVDRFIYAFHMPLFFFLSGLFLSARPGEGAFGLIRRHVLKLGYIYLIWSTAQLALQVAMSDHTNSAVGWSSLWTILIEPPMQFWFLYALLVQALWLGLLDRAGVTPLVSLLIAAILFVTAPFVPLGTWSVLDQARSFLPFTAFGLLMGRVGLSALSAQKSVPLALCAIAGFSAVTLAVEVAPDGLGQTADLPVSLAGVVAAVCLCALWSRAPSRLGQHSSAVLAELGKCSLAIYVAHTIASAGVRIGLQKVMQVDEPLTHAVLGTIAGLVVPVGLYRATQRFNFPYPFEWPRLHARPAVALAR
jgi:fucose 4-O-acetylase-like acetyltransferase